MPLPESFTCGPAVEHVVRHDGFYDDRPTPVLVAGVERRCRVATNPDAAAGRLTGRGEIRLWGETTCGGLPRS